MGPSALSENPFETKEDPSASSGEESAPSEDDESVLSGDERKTPDSDGKWILLKVAGAVIVMILSGSAALITDSL